jgi:peptidoglycan/xylan/chitin deacetylase (PgdA/CDA1 family)
MAEILMFHRVLPQEQIVAPDAYWDRGTLITTAKLDQVLADLDKAGLVVVPLAELVDSLEHGRDSRRLVALTFDDGYSDNHDHALSILQAHGCLACFFPVIGPVCNGEMLPLDRYYDVLDRSVLSEADRQMHLFGTVKEDFITADLARQSAMLLSLETAAQIASTARVAYMSKDQLRTLQSEGHGIGVHTRWHRLLPYMTDDEVKAELEHGLQWVREEFGTAHPFLAYPDGRSSPPIRDLAKELGYRGGLGVGCHRDAFDPFDLPRHFVTMEWDVSALDRP